MELPTLLRSDEYRSLSAIELKGTILDLGGDSLGTYRKLIKGNPKYVTLNLDAKTKPDIFHDLEKSLPLENDSYDHALLINVLEHVYNYRQLLTETARVVRSGGTIIIIVPFLFPVHPSPGDFWRFSESALRREIEALGGKMLTLTALGSGVFAARYVMLDRLMPFPLRAIASVTIRPLVPFFDAGFASLARMFKKKYSPADYALGYCVHVTV